MCNQWDSEDYRQKDVPFSSLDEARQFFEGQARDLSTGDLSIRAVVVNAALR
jgi:hypothetical protein